jgi:hypothetical protein
MHDLRYSPDRRRLNWKTFYYALGFGRRRCPRRAAERELPYYADTYEDPKLWLWSVGIVGACALDAFLTLTILDLGGVELNPAMAWLLKMGPLAFFYGKYLLTALALIFTLLHVNFKLWRIPLRRILLGLFCLYVGLLAYEWWLLTLN